jgi:hypothetical protein
MEILREFPDRKAIEHPVFRHATLARYFNAPVSEFKFIG